MEEFSELFYRNPYMREFDAKVEDCRKAGKYYEVILSDTAFYPEGGGQPGDTGVLGDVRVLDTQRVGGEIVQRTDGPLEAGSRVHGVIDWDRRFANMQGHTGEHILSGLIHRRYGFDNVGFHMGSRIRIDFNGVLTWEQLEEMEREANEEVWADVPVREWYPSAEELPSIEYRSKKELTGRVRIIDIPGADCCACCGTHVKTTGEVGLIKCLSLMHYKGGVRIEMLCGGPALACFQQVWRDNAAVAESLSVKPEETLEAVSRLQTDLLAQKSAAAKNLNRYFQMRAETLPAGQKVLIDFEEDLQPDDIRRLCDLLLREGRAEVAAVLSEKETGTDAGGYSYVIGSVQTEGKPRVNLREKAKDLNRALQGRGGGRPEMIQGAFEANREEIERRLPELLKA